MRIQQYFPYLNDIELAKYHADESPAKFLTQIRFQCSNGERQIFMLMDEDRVCGEAVIDFSKETAGRYGRVIRGKRAYINHISIDKDYCNKGYGQELLKKALDSLKACGYSECAIKVTNIAAMQHILDKFDFTQDASSELLVRKVA